ncbi:hypothetical protein HPP92_012487 [Vanilla planifolia]|uniref:Pentatricopeptide repeat-containing protein n=1 Tax=Vanilla planifolia TaxID=51239 RepID=A0A835R0I5_VANPL|nr:hypothetical protein HPP92_012487 [Vanilla planifolia]
MAATATGGTLVKKIGLLLHPNLSVSLNTFLSSSELRAAHAHLIVSGSAIGTFAASRLLAVATNITSSGDLYHAHSIFFSIPSPTVFSYNTMIRAFSSSINPLHSIHLYLRMLRSGLFPNRLTFPFLLRSCSNLRLVDPGRSIHCHARKIGLDTDVYVINNAITMYSTCADMVSARLVFEEHREATDVVSWTALITGYSNIGDLNAAQQLFDAAPSRNPVTWNAMLAGYARVRRVLDARRLFNRMPERNAASWSSLVSGFVQAGLLRKALAVFRKMARSAAELDHGRWVHRYIDSLGIEMGLIISTALVHMYGKCGGIKEAIQVFNAMPERNIFTWNSMITGLAMSGAGSQALTLFCKMRLAGVEPNAITFIDLLTACSHNGLVEEGQKLFDEMTRVYRIVPEEEHYGCMVDLLGRAGLIQEALEFIGQMPVNPHPGVWGALSNACRIHGEIELGEAISKRLIELEPDHGGRYVHLSNIYGDARRWEDMAMVRHLLKERRAAKPTGSSSVDAT